jgi:hypothetical protein
MADETGAAAPDHQQRDARYEILIAIGLGVAAIVTALCAYLTDVHDDEAQINFNEGVAQVTQASGSYVEASQRRSADEALFTEFAQQAYSGDRGDRIAADQAQYIQTGLMDENLQAAVAWWADANAEDPSILTPFVDENPDYEQPELAEAEELTAASTESFDTAEEEQVLGDTYIIAGVIFATALFLFGIAGVSNLWKLKQSMTWAGYGVLFIGVVYMLVG